MTSQLTGTGSLKWAIHPMIHETYPYTSERSCIHPPIQTITNEAFEKFIIFVWNSLFRQVQWYCFKSGLHGRNFTRNTTIFKKRSRLDILVEMNLLQTVKHTYAANLGFKHKLTWDPFSPERLSLPGGPGNPVSPPKPTLPTAPTAPWTQKVTKAIKALEIPKTISLKIL